MNDINFRMVNITKIYIQFPGQKAIAFMGASVPNTGDQFHVENDRFVVETRIFDPNSRSMTIILREVVE